MRHSNAVFTLLACLSFLPLLAQKGDRLYEQMAYKLAIDRYLESGDMDPATMERIANSYRLNHETVKSEQWYARIVADTDDPLNYLYYAQALQCNGNYSLAQEYYDRYARASGLPGGRLKALPPGERHLPEVQVTAIGNINSEWIDFAPVTFREGLVFASSRPRKGVHQVLTGKADGWTGHHFSTLWYAKPGMDGSWSAPQPFDLRFDTPLHEGPIQFSRDGKVALLSTNDRRRKQGRYNLRISLSNYSGDAWSTPQALDLGAENCNDTHAALSADGEVLIFASDREGGYGGMDLYACLWRGDRWCLPVNLGPNVNTPGNELFPFLHDDGTLYFASDGRGGYGGLDIYFAEGEGELSFAAAINAGTPINSQKDDFGLVLDLPGVHGYLSSARQGGLGKDDVYEVQLTDPLVLKRLAKPRKEIAVSDASTALPVSDALVIALRETAYGTFEGHTPDATVRATLDPVSNLFNLTTHPLDPFDDAKAQSTSGLSDAGGKTVLYLKPGTRYLFFASKTGYADATEVQFAEGDREITLALQPAACVTWQGQVRNRTTGQPLPHAVIAFANLCTNQIVEVMADEAGFYTSPCFSPDCDYLVQGSRSLYRSDNVLVTRQATTEEPQTATQRQDLELLPYVAEGEQAPTALEDKGAGVEETEVMEQAEEAAPRSLNTMLEEGLMVEMKNIYYSLDQYEVNTPNTQAGLDKLADFLLRHPEMNLELRAHTDSRGSATYNLLLSQKRAVAAMDYLIGKGVKPGRLTAKGLGESEPVNRCSAGVPCSEDEHRLNRRTEFLLFIRR